MQPLQQQRKTNLFKKTKEKDLIIRDPYNFTLTDEAKREYDMFNTINENIKTSKFLDIYATFILNNYLNFH